MPHMLHLAALEDGTIFPVMLHVEHSDLDGWDRIANSVYQGTITDHYYSITGALSTVNEPPMTEFELCDLCKQFFAGVSAHDIYKSILRRRDAAIDWVW